MKGFKRRDQTIKKLAGFSGNKQPYLNNCNSILRKYKIIEINSCVTSRMVSPEKKEMSVYYREKKHNLFSTDKLMVSKSCNLKNRF